MVFLTGDIGAVVEAFFIIGFFIFGLLLFTTWGYVSHTEFYKKKIKNEVFPVKLIFASGLILSVILIFLLLTWLLIWVLDW